MSVRHGYGAVVRQGVQCGSAFGEARKLGSALVGGQRLYIFLPNRICQTLTGNLYSSSNWILTNPEFVDFFQDRSQPKSLLLEEGELFWDERQCKHRSTQRQLPPITPIAQCCSFWFRTIDFSIQFSKLIIQPLYHSIDMGLSINNLWGEVGFSEKLIFAQDEGVKEKLLISQ